GDEDGREHEERQDPAQPPDEVALVGDRDEEPDQAADQRHDQRRAEGGGEVVRRRRCSFFDGHERSPVVLWSAVVGTALDVLACFGGRCSGPALNLWDGRRPLPKAAKTAAPTPSKAVPKHRTPKKIQSGGDYRTPKRAKKVHASSGLSIRYPD